MKKTILVVITTLTTLLVLTATAEKKIWLHSHTGNHISLSVTDLDSIGFEAPTVLELSEYSKKLNSKGGSFTLGIITNQAWKVEVNNPIAVTHSKTTGTGSDDIIITTMENTGTKSYSAIITVTAVNGTYKQLILTVAGTESGSLKLDPEVKNLANIGESFSLDIQTDQAWIATVSDPTALTLSKSSGTGNATINVLAVPNADTKPYTEYVTIELEDGTKKQLMVNVSAIDEYVNPEIESKTIEKKGGSFEIYVSSNTFWSVESDQSWLTIEPNSGKFNGKISVNVEANPNRDKEKATLTFNALGGTTSSISIWREGDKVSISPTVKNVGVEGGTIRMAVTSNTDWTATSNKSWAKLSQTSGTGNVSVVITVDSGVKTKADTAIITCITSQGKSATSMVYRAGYTGAGDNVIDIKGKSYPTIWINGQNWMAENLRCNRYDTESEAYREGRYKVPFQDKIVYTTPYYTDASDKSKWDNDSKTKYGVNLTNEQVAKLGYLYNWAAAVGVVDGQKQSTVFSGSRQGICPNGWHVPSDNEWWTLRYNIEWVQGEKSGTHLKTTSGWYDRGEPQIYPQGLDTYGFAALPAGNRHGDYMWNVGDQACFWTATPVEDDGSSIHHIYINCLFIGDMSISHGSEKNHNGLSVRCLKNDSDSPTPTETLSIITPNEKEVSYNGEQFAVDIASNTSWTVKSDKNWVTLSKTNGTGDATIIITVAPGIKVKADTALVTFTTSIGKIAIFEIYRAGYTGAGDNVTDINGNSYPTIWINGQNWMAENLGCNRYDTESEAYNASWLTNNTIPTSEDYVHTPYYTDASDKSLWSPVFGDYSGNLTDAHVARLGYLYNWAAAVGVEDGYEYGTKTFSGNRQGICPNGWHVPTSTEWVALRSYIEPQGVDWYNTAGKHLKTTSGWYDYGKPQTHPQGLDTYGFAALPAGGAFGNSIEQVGSCTAFWTATPDDSNSDNACFSVIEIDDYLNFGSDSHKYTEYSVRCLKD